MAGRTEDIETDTASIVEAGIIDVKIARQQVPLIHTEARTSLVGPARLDLC